MAAHVVEPGGDAFVSLVQQGDANCEQNFWDEFAKVRQFVVFHLLRCIDIYDI